MADDARIGQRTALSSVRVMADGDLIMMTSSNGNIFRVTGH